LISADSLSGLNYINNREDFLKTKDLLFNKTIFFIEPKNNNYYIIREMFPVIFE